MKKKKKCKSQKGKAFLRILDPIRYPYIILIMTSSLSFYVGPSALKKAGRLYRNISGQASAPVSDGLVSDTSRSAAQARTGGLEQDDNGLSEPDTPSIPYLEPSQELGSLDDLSLDKEPEQKEATYTVMLNTAMGPMLYYNQADARWGDYLYGGQDPMKKYGCGPTAVAMIINSFSSTPPRLYQPLNGLLTMAVTLPRAVPTII